MTYITVERQRLITRRPLETAALPQFTTVGLKMNVSLCHMFTLRSAELTCSPQKLFMRLCSFYTSSLFMEMKVRLFASMKLLFWLLELQFLGDHIETFNTGANVLCWRSSNYYKGWFILQKKINLTRLIEKQTFLTLLWQQVNYTVA